MDVRAPLLAAAGLWISTQAVYAANTRCVDDRGQRISRIVALDEASAKELGWTGPGVAGIRPQIAPAERDNGNRTPGQYRFAYFYRDHTTAFYTSHVHPEQATIQFVDNHPTNCGATQ